MNAKKLSLVVDVAAGKAKAELVLKNCRVVNPITRSIRGADIAIEQGVIAGVGKYSGKTEIDARSLFAVAGLIDAHVHIESSMCTPESFAQLVVPKGTTTVIADPHEIANVKGAEGIHFMLNSARRVPLKIHFMVPSCRRSCAGIVLAGAERLLRRRNQNRPRMRHKERSSGAP